MKTLKLSSLFVLLSILSMGMGFPDIISEKEIVEMKEHRKQKNKKTVKTEMMACSREVYITSRNKQKPVEVKAKQDCKKENKASQPCEVSFINQAATSLNNIALKVFDVKGNLLLKQQVRMDDFLSTDYSVDYLPKGSTFVMFYGNTAYYFLDAEN